LVGLPVLFCAAFFAVMLPSDSRVICAAIRTAKADRHLKEAYEEIAANDARRVENK
jgi:hypothetical protein